MHELVNNLPDPLEHSDEIDDTIAIWKRKTRLNCKN